MPQRAGVHGLILRGANGPPDATARHAFVINVAEVAMADDKSKRGRQDRARINVNEDYELRGWSKKFGVTQTELKKTVKKVGPSAAAVKKELGK